LHEFVSVVVSALEKSLSTISEVMEAWIVTQRKWMYLEGIFSGGDIRTQLVEEAKRFDAVDKSIRGVNLKKPYNVNIINRK